MKTLIVLLLLLASSFAAQYDGECESIRPLNIPHSVSVSEFGSTGDGKTLNTVTLNTKATGATVKIHLKGIVAAVIDGENGYEDQVILHCMQILFDQEGIKININQESYGYKKIY
ncbi:uncharacterized protein [Henckelia pumila]|uniref:uncharacterized protein isoform X2 n=1 Tax=Henckelia pumila TaxID=405737 RepID=UPI003C6E1B23